MTPKQEKDRKAILTLAHHDFERGLNTHAFFKVSDHAIGEDLVQETFMKTWKYLVKGGQIDVMKAFLYHVLNNLIVDQYRKKKTSSLDLLLEKGFEPSAEEQGSQSEFMDGESAVLLIAQLPPTYQKVLRMRYVQDLSLITGQTKNALAVQVHRGVQKLKLLYNRNEKLQIKKAGPHRLSTSLKLNKTPRRLMSGVARKS